MEAAGSHACCFFNAENFVSTWLDYYMNVKSFQLKEKTLCRVKRM